MTVPIDRDNLDELITYHQDRIHSQALTSSSYELCLLRETVRALQLLRDLIGPESGQPQGPRNPGKVEK